MEVRDPQNHQGVDDDLLVAKNLNIPLTANLIRAEKSPLPWKPRSADDSPEMSRGRCYCHHGCAVNTVLFGFTAAEAEPGPGVRLRDQLKSTSTHCCGSAVDRRGLL